MQMNLLPESLLLARQTRLTKKKVQKLLRVLAFIVCLGAAYEALTIGFYYFTREQAVPMGLQQEYDKALNKSQLIKQRNALYVQAEKEDRALIQAIETLVALKPPEINMTRLEIPHPGQTIQMEGYAFDPAVFNRYVEQINSKDKVFRNAKVERITTSAAGKISYKMFLIRAEIIK